MKIVNKIHKEVFDGKLNLRTESYYPETAMSVYYSREENQTVEEIAGTLSLRCSASNSNVSCRTDQRTFEITVNGPREIDFFVESLEEIIRSIKEMDR